MKFNIPVGALCLTVAATGALAHTVAAQQTIAQRNAHLSAPVPSAAAALRTSPITIDGRLDEEAWKLVTPITELRQQRPVEGGPATLATEIRVLYDDEALYV